MLSYNKKKTAYDIQVSGESLITEMGNSELMELFRLAL